MQQAQRAHVGRAGYRQAAFSALPFSPAASTPSTSTSCPARLHPSPRPLTSAAVTWVDGDVVRQRLDSTPCYDFGSRAEQGPVRETMEDEITAYFNEKGGYIYCSAIDGHGGEAAARWLASGEGALHTAVDRAVAAVPRGADLQPVLVGTFEKADKLLLRHLEQVGGEAQASAGATATVVLVFPDRMVAANIGDSQAWISRKGFPVALTTPHRVYGNGKEVDKEVARVKSVGGWIYDGRVCNILAVSRAFGDWEFKGKGLKKLVANGITRGYWNEKFASQQSFSGDPVIVTPDTCVMELGDTDELMVVSTDGLWDVVPPADVMRWARKYFMEGKNSKEVASALVDIALKRYSADNIGCVVVDLKGPAYWDNLAKAKSTNFFSGLFGSR